MLVIHFTTLRSLPLHNINNQSSLFFLYLNVQHTLIMLMMTCCELITPNQLATLCRYSRIKLHNFLTADWAVKTHSILYLTLSCPGTGRAVVKIGHSNLRPGSKELNWSPLLTAMTGTILKMFFRGKCEHSNSSANHIVFMLYFL